MLLLAACGHSRLADREKGGHMLGTLVMLYSYHIVH